jgi:carboxypeptidase family protein
MSGGGDQIMRCSSSSVLCAFSAARCLWLKQSVFLFALVLASSLSLAAQEATIVGTVSDQTGGLLPSVTVTIVNTQTGTLRTSVTNSVGQYVAFGLPIGTYDVKAESPGFGVQESQGVVLNVNDRVRVDFRMKIGTKIEPILVESIPIGVQPDSGEQSSLVSGTRSRSFPEPPPLPLPDLG